MRQRVIPILAPVTKPRLMEGRSYQTKYRGMEVLNSPLLNKGSAFTIGERKALFLTGLFPPQVSTLDAQVKLAYIQYDRSPDALSKNGYLTTLVESALAEGLLQSPMPDIVQQLQDAMWQPEYRQILAS